MTPKPTGRLSGNDLVLTRTFRAPIDDVWTSVTSSESTARWFGPWERVSGDDDTKIRLQMLAEQLEIVHRSFNDESFSFAGEHSTLEDCRAEPKPLQQPHLPLIVGGRGGPKSLALCARWADEYNTVFSTPDRCREVREGLLRAFEARDRDPGEAHLSLMTGAVIGENRDALLRRAGALAAKRGGGDGEAFLASAGEEWIAGTVDEAAEKLRALQDAGVERVMLQHLAHEDVEMVALIGQELVPALA